MKGITPVIAIILLLLMAVAAAGGFYFVYQNFASSGEESGSTQIDALGEQTLSQIKIESAAGGRLYIRNTGATDIDASKLSVFVEDVPVSVNSSSDTLAENSRATLKLTQVPTCTSERCEVKVSGPASTTQTIDLAKLLCSTDADCLQSESCEGGLCVGGAECGDGVCDYPVEDGMTCFEDCHPEFLLGFDQDMVDMDYDVYDYAWNGSTYVKDQDLTQTPLMEIIYKLVLDGSGNTVAVGSQGVSGVEDDVVWLRHDGSDWSSLETVSAEPWSEGGVLLDFDVDSVGNVLAVWQSGMVDGNRMNVSWAEHDGSSWSVAENLTENTVGISVYPPQVSFGPGDVALATWGANAPSGNAWLNYSFWDGESWGEIGTLSEVAYGGSSVYVRGSEVESNETHFMVVWYEADYTYDTPGVLKWATWDGSSWDGPHNVTDDRNEFDDQMSLEANDDGWIMVVNQGEEPSWLHWYSWDDGWTLHGNLTTQNLAGKGLMTESQFGEIMTFYVGIDMASPDYRYSVFNGEDWADYVQFGS